MNPHSFQSIKLQCELYVLISYHIKCISIFYCDFFSPDRIAEGFFHLSVWRRHVFNMFFGTAL